ncbi:MAG: DNA ligase D [Gemmatimonadota bacterium]
MSPRLPNDPDARLADYRAKRDPTHTPEPFGGQVLSGGSAFVVQHHAARQLHWDLRLEHEGALLSWAVPKGPSPSQADKRLAVRTEDHPLEYAEFEGVIPQGEYGAGAMIVWDRGVWVPKEDFDQGLQKGKLLFELHGHKLKGLWTLVKTKQDDRSWLLIKERDAHEDPDGSTEAYPHDSIYSGLTVEEFPEIEFRAQALRARLEEAGARRRPVFVGDISPMLATSEDRPFSRDGWLFELKYDGYRLLAGREDGVAVLLSRNGNDLTATFPDVARAVRGLPYQGLVLDGEVVVHGPDGKPSFGQLQKRGRIARPLPAVRASWSVPATLYAFDVLAVEGYDLRALPLTQRKAILEDLVPTVGPVRYSEHIERDGEAMFAEVERMDLEGIVAKDGGAVYRGGRSRSWIKLRRERVEDFVVVGWTEGEGSRGGFGALHLARWDGDELRYAGSVGSGFSQRDLVDIGGVLEEGEVDASPCTGGPVPDGPKHHWARPELVVEVRFKERTEQGLLRHPVFNRLRDDKEPGECRDDVPKVEWPPPLPPAENGPRFTNLDKLFWPADGYTKGDLLEYHRLVAPWMLAYLRDRPLVMTRYPDGIDGKSFFQKDAPPHAPDWIRTLTVWSEGSERELSYFVADDVDALLYVVNLGTIPIHIWSSRADSIDHPDWCVLDLDPKEAPFEDVVTVALEVRALCDEIGLPSYPKTSGSFGMHVLLPLAGRLDHDQSRTLAELLGRVVVTRRPDIATLTRAPGRREGKVYIDFVQNGHGRLIAAPFTVRPLPGAPVSAPLDWGEVGPGLALADYTIRTVPERMERLGRDPLAPVLDEEPDLMAALGKLGELVG